MYSLLSGRFATVVLSILFVQLVTITSSCAPSPQLQMTPTPVVTIVTPTPDYSSQFWYDPPQYREDSPSVTATERAQERAAYAAELTAEATRYPYTGWKVTVDGMTFISDCQCEKQGYTCASFHVAWSAQSCYLRCIELTGRDIHLLDPDLDGNACAWPP